MTESKKIQLRTVGALSLSVVSSISIVICNKALITTLGFNFGAEWWAQQFGKSLPFLSWVPVINGMLLREKGILQHHQLIDEFENVVGEDGVMKELKESPFSQILKFAQNIFAPKKNLWMEKFGTWSRYNENFVLELDFEPFNTTFPRPTQSSSIGNGVQFLNRHLSSIMFCNKESLEPLLHFFRTHKHNGLMALFRGLVDNPYWCMEKNFHFCVELI